jgi:adenylyl-sulfate kinase
MTPPSCNGRVLWLTGLSGAGKTTIATELSRRLKSAGVPCHLLDGDEMRKGLCRDLGFSSADRQENIRRAGEVAVLMAEAGLTVIAAFISPFREGRDAIRRRLPPDGFVEIYVNAPLAVCETRDVKGLYARARAQQLPEFTGITSPYEAPLHPEVELLTAEISVDTSVSRILAILPPPAGQARQPTH